MPRRPGTPAGPPPSPQLPTIHRAGEHTTAAIEEHLRAGRWVRVHRGAYVSTGLDQDSGPPRPAGADPGRGAVNRRDRFTAARRHALARIAAVVARTRGRFVVSHESAALLWGLPLVEVPSTVHLICPWSTGGRDRSGITRHVVKLAEDDVVLRSGLRVTSLERTLVDCATALPADGGLVVADAALHAGAVREVCAQILAERAGGRGVARARAVLEVADDGAESAGETRARLALLRLGIRRPVTQVEVRTHLGTFWSDLGWPEWDVVGEYDGVAKYGGTGAAAQEVLREKRREDAVIEAGTTMVRLVSDDLRHPRRLDARMRRVLPPEAFGHPVDPHLQP